jgi:hypothetical protein
MFSAQISLADTYPLELILGTTNLSFPGLYWNARVLSTDKCCRPLPLTKGIFFRLTPAEVNTFTFSNELDTSGKSVIDKLDAVIPPLALILPLAVMCPNCPSTDKVPDIAADPVNGKPSPVPPPPPP